MRIASIILLLLNCLPAFAWGQADLENRLSSKDPAVSKAAAYELIKNADDAEALSMILAAARLFESDDKDQAVYWYYAGQLRARYTPKLAGENSQLISIFAMTFGAPINAYAMLDIGKLSEIIKKVLLWDEKTFVAWCKKNEIDPQGVDIVDRHKQAREGLVTTAEKLLANREQVEKQAREYKSPEQRLRESEEILAKSIEKNYTTAVVERTIGDRTLRIPANYISPRGLTLPPKETPYELTLTIFFPDLGGYTKDNWRSRDGLSSRTRDRMIVTVSRDDKGRKAEALIDAFMASSPPTTKAFDQEVYIYDYRMPKAKLPGTPYGMHYVLGSNEAKNSFYLSCDAPEHGIMKEIQSCELFFLDHASGVHMHTRFEQNHIAQWKQLRERLSSFLEQWLGNKN